MKKLKILLLSTCLMGNALASEGLNETQMSFKALFDFKAAVRSQNHLEKDEKNVSANRKNFGFSTQAALYTKISQTTENGLTYGGKIVLVPTTKAKGSPSYNGSHLFVESEFGRFEGGSPFDAGSQMRITAGDIDAGSDWDSFVSLDGKYMTYKEVAPEFAAYGKFFFDDEFKFTTDQPHNKNPEPPRLISYFTPKFNGLQIGVSYIPDSSNTGATSHTTASSGKMKSINISEPFYTSKFKINNTVKDAFSLGIAYEKNITDGVDIKVAFTGEYGRAAKNASEKREYLNGRTETIDYKLSNLKTYNIGGILSFGNFSYALSYGSLGNSLTFKEYHKAGRNTTYYNGAIAYDQGPLKASITYFKSRQFKNEVDAVTLGTSYKIAQGAEPYFQITPFKAKGRPTYYEAAPKKKTKGVMFIGGLKLSL